MNIKYLNYFFSMHYFCYHDFSCFQLYSTAMLNTTNYNIHFYLSYIQKTLFIINLQCGVHIFSYKFSHDLRHNFYPLGPQFLLFWYSHFKIAMEGLSRKTQNFKENTKFSLHFIDFRGDTILHKATITNVLTNVTFY